MRRLVAILLLALAVGSAAAGPRQPDPAAVSSTAPIVWPRFKPAMSATAANNLAMAPQTPRAGNHATKIGGPVGGR